MPKVRLYNRDVRFHSANIMNPLQFTAAAYQGHTAWGRITPMVYMRTDTLDDFTNMANRFAATGLTGSLGETGASSWSFAGTTAARVGTAVAYMIDMYRAFYASRGISHDGRIAWWPANIGYVYGGSTLLPEYHRQYALIPSVGLTSVVGSTADSLQLYTWTGSTASQAAVLADSIYVSAGLTAFTNFVTEIADGLSAAVAARPGIAAPAILASEYENWPAQRHEFFTNGDNTQEMGSWIQSLNDPRATTYQFFDRCTLFDMWGATGASAQSFRSPYQRTQPFTITACDGSSSITVTSGSVDVIWSERLNFLNYTPGWTNFFGSLSMRHREHLLNRGYQPLRNRFANMLIGNYQNTASSRRFPIIDRNSTKIHGYTYSCDVNCTGPNSQAGFSSGVTGTFSFDYSCPVLYTRNGGNDVTLQDGHSNFLPGYGTVAASSVYDRYSGAWGTSALLRIGATGGLLSQGSFQATYNNFLQYLSSQGITSTVGGGTAEGYTGGNILDLRNYWLQSAKNIVTATRRTLDYFDDNSHKPVIPWLGSFAMTYRSIFSLTASGSGSTVYNDANGLSGYFVSANDPLLLDYNVNIVKYCIQTHNITDFFVFDANGINGLSAGIDSLNFWNNVVENLLLDSNNPPVARISVLPSTNVRDNDGSGYETLIASGLSSSDAQNDALTYSWTTNSGLSASGPTASFLFAVGNHTIYLTVSDPYGATGSTSTQVSVQPNTIPFADFSAVPGLQATDNDDNGSETFAFDASSSTDSNGGSILQYNWLFDGSIAASGVTASIAFTVTGSPHTALLTVVDNGGATATMLRQITVLPKPAPNRGPGAVSSTSMMMFGGKIYTRNEFDNLLRAFYPNLLR